jgi:hypothetical protein
MNMAARNALPPYSFTRREEQRPDIGLVAVPSQPVKEGESVLVLLAVILTIMLSVVFPIIFVVAVAVIAGGGSGGSRADKSGKDHDGTEDLAHDIPL